MNYLYTVENTSFCS